MAASAARSWVRRHGARRVAFVPWASGAARPRPGRVWSVRASRRRCVLSCARSLASAALPYAITGDRFASCHQSGSLAMSSGRDSPSSGRCKVLPRAITRSSLAWDRRRGATCVLGVIRQIIHAPARDERRACGPYQKGTRSGVVKTPGQSTGQPGRGMAEPPHCRRRQQRSRISSTSRDRHPRRRQRRHAGKVM